MNLDEFKSRWNDSISADKKAGAQGNALDETFRNAMEKASQLASTSKRWWLVAALGVGLAVILLLATVALYLIYPEQLASLKNAVPALILLPAFVGGVGVLYYTQARIFEVHAYHTLSSALHQAIHRFRQWYMLSLVIFAVFLVPVYYFLLIGISFKFDIALSKNVQVSFAVLLTLLTLVLNHLHYRRTYFHWIGVLKKNMDELGR